MFDFETTMKMIVTFAVGAFTLIMTGVGIKVLFFRRGPRAVESEQLDGLDDRLQRNEAKLSELEERLDFAERMLTEVRAKGQLRGKP